MVAPYAMHPAKAERLHNNSLHAAARKPHYCCRKRAGYKLDKRHARLYIRKKVKLAGVFFVHTCHRYKYAVLKPANVGAVYRFKCVKRHRSCFDRPTAPYHAAAKAYVHAAGQQPCRLQRIAKVPQPVRIRRAYRVLRSGKDYWLIYAPKHERKHGRGIRHCVRSVCYNYAVIFIHGIYNRFRHYAPFLRLNVGAVHSKKLHAVNIFGSLWDIGKQLLGA